jgi:hypothetical protein
MKIRLRKPKKRENAEKVLKTPKSTPKIARKKRKDVTPSHETPLKKDEILDLASLARDVVEYAKEMVQESANFRQTGDLAAAAQSYANGFWSVAVDYSMRQYKQDARYRRAFNDIVQKLVTEWRKERGERKVGKTGKTGDTAQKGKIQRTEVPQQRATHGDLDQVARRPVRIRPRSRQKVRH